MSDKVIAENESARGDDGPELQALEMNFMDGTLFVLELMLRMHLPSIWNR